MLDYNFKKYTEVYLIFVFSLALITPILGPYIKSIGFSNTEAGFIFAVLPLSIIIFLPIIGSISDRIGRRSIICMALIAEIVALILYTLDGHIASIFIARILDAIAASSLPLIILAKIEDGIKKDRGRLSGVFLGTGYIGILIGNMAGGLLADQFFIRFPFIVSIVIISILFLALIRNTKFRFNKIKKADFNVISDIRTFLSFKDLRVMGMLGIFAHATLPATSLFLPIFIIENLGLTNTHIGLAFFIMGVTHLLQAYFGKLGDKIGNARNIIFGLLITGFMFCLILIVETYTTLILILFIMGIGRSMWNVSAWTLMSDIGEKVKKEGLVVTSYLSIAKIGAFVSFFVSGIIVDMYSFKFLAFLSGILLIMASLVSIFMFSKKYLVGSI